MKFLDVFIGYPGSVHDARVFKNSPLRNTLHELCESKKNQKIRIIKNHNILIL